MLIRLAVITDLLKLLHEESLYNIPQISLSRYESQSFLHRVTPVSRLSVLPIMRLQRQPFTGFVDSVTVGGPRAAGATARSRVV